MLQLEVIESSKNSWSSPICLVRKKDNNYNASQVTKKDTYAISYIYWILEHLKNASYISSIDTKSAFWQVPLSDSSKETTAFTSPCRDPYEF